MRFIYAVIRVITVLGEMEIALSTVVEVPIAQRGRVFNMLHRHIRNKAWP